MSRKYSYGKSKSHGGGAGLQFDKLLKACSNSKKPSVTNTTGAVGRFGITSFTSTRKAAFDDSITNEEQTFPLPKRPRFDVDRNLSELNSDSYPYVENFMMPFRTGSSDPPPVPAVIIKPKKFFKSRNTDAEQSQGTTETPPPLPMPIKIPTPRVPQTNQIKPAGSKKQNRKKLTTSRDCSSETEGSVNTNNAAELASESNTSSTSPSIKLRIFKDKKTAKFVLVSDTTLPPKLEAQVQKQEIDFVDTHPKKRGRKPKTESEVVKTSSKSIKALKAKPIPSRRSGRLTRNSSSLRSNSIGDMPVLTAEEDSLESDEGDDLGQPFTPLPRTDTDAIIQPELQSQSVEKVDSAEQLVQRLQEEDVEFRELSAMLSSMEEVPESQNEKVEEENVLDLALGSASPLPQTETNTNEFQEKVTPQPSPIDYSRNVPESCRSPSFSTQITVETQGPNPESVSRDFRTILEDEWDETCEDESPRRSSLSPTKVSRFVMPEFSTENPLPSPPSGRNSSKNEHFYDLPNFSTPVPLPAQPPLNSSYSVRNLISEITNCESDFQTNCPSTEYGDIPLESRLYGNEESRLPRTPEKPVTSRDIIGSAKKVSIFKSRINPMSNQSGSAINPKKRLALYKHKFGQGAVDKVDLEGLNPNRAANTLDDGFGETLLDSSEPLSLRRSRTGEDGNELEKGSSKVYCSQQTKRLFTVVRNVKAVHELQESGEVHEFDGDIWYILEDLKQSNPVSSRCLSAITLATRCMEPAFRMHLRAHGTVAEFSKELRDAPNNIPVLALAAATVLFVLSQDRLNMDLDTESFLLILALAKTEQNSHLLDENPELIKHKQRIIDLVQEMKNRGHAKHIKVEKISASELALETLLFLTSKRAGEWVKRELRTLGGLDYIVTEVEKSLSLLEWDIVERGWGEAQSDLLWKIDRCLKVLQQVTFNHEENQKYLLGLTNPTTDLPPPLHSPELFVRLFRFLSHHVSYQAKDSDHFLALQEVLFSVLRVLVNLTHDYRGIVLGSEILSSHEGFLYLTLQSIFKLSTSFVDGKGFDLMMHSLCMLLNIVEHSRRNREVVLGMKVQLQLEASSGGDAESFQETSTLDALVQFFFKKESEAQKEEASTDDILTNSTEKKDSQSSQASGDSQSLSQDSKDGENSSVQDIIDKLIETAGKHMESSMIAAHISLLIAYLVMHDSEATSYLIKAMPNSRLLPLMILLKKLFNFMSITTSTAGSTRGLKAASVALKFFEQCDPESATDLKRIIPD